MLLRGKVQSPPKGGQGQGGERKSNLLSKTSGTSSGQIQKISRV